MRKQHFKKTLSYSILVLAIILTHWFGWLKPLENMLIRIAEPVLARLYHSGRLAGSFYESQAERRKLNINLEDLADKNEQLILENARFKMVDEENAELRRFLDFSRNKEKKLVMANIIAGGEVNLVNGTIMIDKGSRNGISAGLAVADKNGQVIGKVVGLADETAKICLSNQEGCQFAAAILNQNRTIGLLKGSLGLSSQLDFIPQTENLEKGMIIITSGLEKNIARGQVLGQITEITKETNALWQSAKVEPLNSLTELSIVAVLLP
jgi:rod shape-determining protein MreC